MKTVAVIILNWNQPNITIDTINSLKKSTSIGYNYHIFLVDNGSDSNSKHLFDQHYSKDSSITISYLPNNLGFTGGNNFGIKLALKQGFNYILLLNNDTLVHPTFLKNLIDPLLADNSIGMISPKIYFAPGHEFHSEIYLKTDIGKVIWSVGGIIDWNNLIFKNRGIDQVDKGQYDQPTTDIDFISGCCALIPASVFKSIGLFDNRYYLYDEDIDLSQRILRSGLKLYYQPKSIIWHLNSGSSRSGGGFLHDYFMTRNRLLFGFRYVGNRTKFALFRDSIKILIIGSIWQKRGIFDYYFNRLGKGSWQ